MAKQTSFKASLEWALKVLRAHAKELTDEELFDHKAQMECLENRLKMLTKKKGKRL